MEITKYFIQIAKELFEKGEILKSQYLVNNCVPLDIKNSPDIIEIREKINNHIYNIKRWSIEGRPYPGTHATVEFNSFPKFILAKDKIIKKFTVGRLLDIGCYSGVFLEEMSRNNFDCWGIDIHKELMDKLNEKSVSDPFYQFGESGNIPMKTSECDIITTFDVLEHVIDLDKSIDEMERVCKSGGLIIINLPRMTIGYKDESHEHLRMFDDEDINRIWGNKKDFTFEFCKDEYDNPTSFITYIND